MSVFTYVENTRNLLYLLVQRHYKFRARNDHCRFTSHKIGTLATSLFRCMKDGMEP